jgi:hypothetical protein
MFFSENSEEKEKGTLTEKNKRDFKNAET